MKIFIRSLALPLLWLSSVSGSRYSLECLSVDCSSHHSSRCCSSHHQGVARSLQPLANWRFGSIFRNSIPPVRPYKVPTFEEIFEKDHSATTESAQQVLLNLKPAHSAHNSVRKSEALSENNRNSQIESPSDFFPKWNTKKYNYEDIFESQPKITSTTMSYEDLRKRKLLELAKKELKKKQRIKSQRIKSQQNQEKFLKLNKYLQSQKKKISEKTPRSQQLDNFFSKIQGFSSSKTSQFKPDLIKKYQTSLMKKSDQEEQSQYSAVWKNKKVGQGFSKINGQQYLDKSMETRILDGSHIASLRHPVQPARHDVVTTVRTTTSTTTTTTTTPPPPPKRVWTMVDEGENETENESTVRVKAEEKEMFTTEVCEKLRVPCRFVTEHPCCSLPQDIDMMGRPRAMDGSADLKWRYYQSRGGTRLGSGRGKSPEGRMMTGFVSSRDQVYNNRIPYNSWKSPTDIRVPRYFYDGGPDLTHTILSQCWRLTYLTCSQDSQHPCCELRDRSDHLANNLLDKWLRRY